MTKNTPVVIACLLAILGVLTFGIWLQWDGLLMTVKVGDLAGRLAPIAFAAAVVERGVEILISPWRDTGASKLERDIADIKAKLAALGVAAVADDLQKQLLAKSNELDEYRGITQRYAFAVSLVLSTFVSIAGVRALAPFLDSTKPTAFGHGQHLFFLCVDVVLSATLLAGGADGVHSVVNAATSFFDATAEKATQSNTSV